jgi:cytochrome c oxidase assembly protein subunit 15
VLALAALAYASRLWRQGASMPALAIAIILPVQIAVGIATLLTGVEVSVAALHQALAAVLLAALVWGAHRAGRRTRR